MRALHVQPFAFYDDMNLRPRIDKLWRDLQQGLGNAPSDTSATEDGPRIPARAIPAMEAYQYVVNTFDRDDMTDREVYQQLSALYEQNPEKMQERFGFLWSYDTFSRYLREHRRATGSQKHRRRNGREGGSIVRADEI